MSLSSPIPNLRDLGGHVIADGRVVARGRVYRSAQLNPMPPDGLAWLSAQGVRRAFDLRSADEVRARPDVLPEGVESVHLDVLADAQNGVSPIAFSRMLRNPKEASQAMNASAAATMLEHSYREMVFLPSARAGYSSMFRALAAEDGMPALLHCTAGKDRTGWAVASLLALLGVPRAAIEADYLASNDGVRGLFQPMIDMFVAAGGDAGILTSLLEARIEYLDAGFDELRTRHRTIDAWFADGLGIDDAGQNALRRALLT